MKYLLIPSAAAVVAFLVAFVILCYVAAESTRRDDVKRAILTASFAASYFAFLWYL